MHFLPSSALMNVTFSQRHEFVYVSSMKGIHRIFFIFLKKRHEFVYVSSSMNWMNAQKYCRQNYADLVNTVDQVDHNELLKTAGLGKFWLGLYRTTGNGVFVWLDQSRSSFTRWKLGQQENELCVRVYDGYWYDRDCDLWRSVCCVRSYCEVRSDEEVV
uniref:C-type lectin domain-containing protein n=1 Tax=Sinocyclocheilus rhinocerous TaxID=307959 RepID=A0A673HNP4_9TELE